MEVEQKVEIALEEKPEEKVEVKEEKQEEEIDLVELNTLREKAKENDLLKMKLQDYTQKTQRLAELERKTIDQTIQDVDTGHPDVNETNGEFHERRCS